MSRSLVSCQTGSKLIQSDVEIGRALVSVARLDAPDSRLRASNLVGDALIRQSVRGDLFNDVFCGIHANDYTRMNRLVNAGTHDYLHSRITRTNTQAMNNEAKQIGDALDKAMTEYNGGKGIKQAELARLSGVSQPTISRTLSGKSIPETGTLANLVAILGADTLGKSIAAILGNNKPGSASLSVMMQKFFALPCPECGHVSHESFIDLEQHDTIACAKCGTGIRVANYYGQPELAKFIDSIGVKGFVFRRRQD